MAGHFDDGFGEETTPDLSDANWADTGVFVKSYESVGHEGSNGCPGTDVIRKPRRESGHRSAKCEAGCFVADEPFFEGGAISASEASCPFEVSGNRGNNVWGCEEFGTHWQGGIVREVGGREVSGWFGMFGLQNVHG